MNLQPKKLIPGSVNDRGTKPMTKSDMSMNRKGAGMSGKQVNPRQIPTTMGYMGRRISK